MKILIFSNAYGNLDLVNQILDQTDVSMAFSLGDLVLASESSPLDKLIREKYRNYAMTCIEWNKQSKFFQKPVFALFGSMDDPFIPLNELNIKNLFPVWNGTNKYSAFSKLDKKTKVVTIGTLGGYYNIHNFRYNNSKRSNFCREKKTLSLCVNDFEEFKNRSLDILLSYESPIGYPINGIGCPNILSLIKTTNCKLSIFVHHRVTKIFSETYEQKLISLGKLENVYIIADIYNNIINIYFHDKLKIINTKEVVYG